MTLGEAATEDRRAQQERPIPQVSLLEEFKDGDERAERQKDRETGRESER